MKIYMERTLNTMKNTCIIRIFKKFLIKHRAYEAYCEAMNEECDNIYAKLMKSDNPYNFVGGYFSWEETAKENDFWADLDDEWNMFLDNYLKL